MEDLTMSLVRFSNQFPALFDRFFEGDVFDWSNRNFSNTNTTENYTRREFSYQSFCRTFTLPSTVDNEKIAASYENGLLKVSIPKKEEAKPKPARQIEIS